MGVPTPGPRWGHEKAGEGRRDGIDVFSCATPEVVREAIGKYGHLTRPGYFDYIHQNRVCLWESHYLDGDGGTTTVEGLIAEGRGNEVFCLNGSPPGAEARAKYEYLLKPTAQLTTMNDESSSDTYAQDAILESVCELIPEPPLDGPKQEESRHKSSLKELSSATPSLARFSSPSKRTTITPLAFLPLLALELYLIYHRDTEWTSWYN